MIPDTRLAGESDSWRLDLAITLASAALMVVALVTWNLGAFAGWMVATGARLRLVALQRAVERLR